MVKKNRDASVRIASTVSLLLHLQRQLTEAETVALVKQLRAALPVTTLEIREEQFLQASWQPK
jgi:hypothetical protein